MESMCGVDDIGAEKSGLNVGENVYLWSVVGWYEFTKVSSWSCLSKLYVCPSLTVRRSASVM